MKKKILCLILSISLVFSSQSMAVHATDYSTGTPWIDSSLVGNITKDSNYLLKDDFAAAINKEWLLSNEIPEGYSDYAYLALNQFILKDDLIAILEDKTLTDHNAELTQFLYNMHMDWDTRDALGMTPALPYLYAIDSIQTMDDLRNHLINDDITSFASLFSAGMTTNMLNSDIYELAVDAPALLLDDSAEYTNTTEYGALVKEVASDMLVKLFIKAGYSPQRADSIVNGCFTFEGMMAPYIFTYEEQSAADIYDKIINPHTREEMLQLEGPLPIIETLEADGFGTAPVYNIYTPQFLEGMKSLYKEENLELMKDYLLAHTMNSLASYLDKESFMIVIEAGNALNGSEGMLPLQDYAESFVESSLGEPLSQLYCDKHYTKTDKEKVKKVMDDIVAEYKNMLANEEFLSSTTRAAAIEKLDAMQIRALYPDEWNDYSALTLDEESCPNLISAISRIGYYGLLKEIKELNNPVDKTVWADIPLTVNAYYNPTDNSVNLLAGLVGNILYNDSMSIEQIYAYVGMVIGHEITHGFDSSGAQYDKNGNYANWWTDEDYATFQAKVQKLDEYYDSIIPWEGMQYVGSIVDTEAIADMGAMACMMSLASKIDNFNYDLFFRSYAQLWADKCTPNLETYMIQSDTHPLSYLRINAVIAQFDEFYKTYDIKPGDGMYIAPEDRVAIW